MGAIKLGSRLGENLLINPLMDLIERGAGSLSFIAPANSTYTLDRWLFSKNGTMVQTINQSTDVPVDSLAKYSLESVVTTAQASLTGFNLAILSQKVEGHNFLKVKGRNSRVNFRVKAPIAGTYCVSFQNEAQDKSYIVEYEIAVANTWERKSVKMKHDPTGTWNYGNGIGVQVIFCYGVGDSFANATTDSWVDGTFIATPNQVNAVGTIANEFKVTEISFHEGLDEIPFRDLIRDIGTERALAHRYFVSLAFIQSSNNYIGRYRDFGSPGGAFTMGIPQPLRVDPVVVKVGGLSLTAATATQVGTTINSFGGTRLRTDTEIAVECNLSAEINGGSVGMVENLGGGYIHIDSEL